MDYDHEGLRLVLAGIQLQALCGGRTRYVGFHLMRRGWSMAYNLTAVLLKSGPCSGKIAVIAEIIDHNRVRRMVSVFCYSLLKSYDPRLSLTVQRHRFLARPSLLNISHLRL
jgi:hypothetical protein